MTTQVPSIGRIVHYVTATEPYGLRHHAAIVTEIRPAPAGTGHEVMLTVFAPHNTFESHEWLAEDPAGTTPYSWHWPERE